MQSVNLSDLITTGESLSRDRLIDLASNLPEGLVLTVSVAFEVGTPGPISFGAEGTRMDIYAPDGTVTTLTSGAATLGADAIPGPPLDFAGEIGIGYVGNDGPTAFEGFAVTVEGGFVVGAGVTVARDQGLDYIDDALAAASTGDFDTIVSALGNAPTGTIIFVSSGTQAGGTIEYSYTFNPDNTLLVNIFGHNGYVGPQDFSGPDYGVALAHVEQNRTTATISWEFVGEDGETYTVTQQIIPGGDNGNDGVFAAIRTEVTGPDGKLSESQLNNLGFSRTEAALIKDGGFQPKDSCFEAQVPVAMWPANQNLRSDANGLYNQSEVRSKTWYKPIEEIEPGDLVVSFDADGNLVPGPVTRVFENDAKILLDFHGTKVTPGHVYLRPDSRRAHKFETLIDVLRDDGVIQHQDGTLIRAATNVPVGDARDGFVQAVTGARNADGQVVPVQTGRIRLGTRFIYGEGDTRRSYAVADLIEAGGGVVGEDELIRMDGDEGMPFHWEFSDTLPAPEDFVLACSGTTLEDIYKAAEWEAQGPRLPAPMVLDGGQVKPLTGAALSAMPRNEPLDVVHNGKGE